MLNLFAFLCVGYILDAIFESGNKLKIVMLVLSVISLVVISNKYFKKAFADFEKLSPTENTDKDTKQK